MSLIRKHGAVLQAWACLDLVLSCLTRFLEHWVQVIAWKTVSEITYNVSSRTLNLSHSLNLYEVAIFVAFLP